MNMRGPYPVINKSIDSCLNFKQFTDRYIIVKATGKWYCYDRGLRHTSHNEGEIKVLHKREHASVPAAVVHLFFF